MEKINEKKHTLSQSEVLDLATCMGYYILKNGGEISRAEDTAERIGKAYGMDAVHVFAISATIVVSVEKGDVSLSQTRRVKDATTDLDALEKYNSLSRKICENLPDYNEVVSEIRKIKNTPSYPLWIMVLAFATVGGAFSVFFGGGIKELFAGFLIGALLKVLLYFIEILQATPFLANVAGAALTVFLSYIFSFIFPGTDTECVNIGVLMNLVPGVLLTNCIRDFVAKDYIAATAKIGETFLIAAAIALGVAVSLLWR